MAVFDYTSDTLNVNNPMAVRAAGLQALKEALGPVGAVKFLQLFDHGGSGDYTKEKYESPDVSLEEILGKFQESHNPNSIVFQ